MKKMLKTLLSTALLNYLCISQVNAADYQYLNKKQESIIAISVHTTLGELTKLKGALNSGLNAGLSINEIKEIMIQLYAYAGFPRSLNGINTFMQVLENRKSKGIQDQIGKEPSDLPENFNRNEYGETVRAKLGGRKNVPKPSGYQVFVPTIDTFLKEHLFADIFVRDNFDHQSRELETISILSSLPGLEGQLKFHLNAAMNTGLSKNQLLEFIEVIAKEAGPAQAKATKDVLDEILKTRN